ncbi:hypothetical protein F5050DRAFT_1241826 [Lentinula boryana]|uniref:Homeobox domain-containing protein n=1 Tax=Lentinula boryana TaxID=40481 RepID=A0ABQ8QSY4_9AGAR|nr:hypothetical protein F5050DRAFT_1241826 [Lentinula boryana]
MTEKQPKAEQPIRKRVVTTKDQLTILDEVFNRTSGRPSSKEYAELGKLTGLAHKFIIGWFSRKRHLKRKERLTESETDDCRSSISDKVELANNTDSLFQRKKKKKVSKTDLRDAIALVKAEIVDAIIPPSPRSTSLSPHTSNSADASNQVVQSSPLDLTEKNHLPQSAPRVMDNNNDPPPVYTNSLNTDGFIIYQPAACVNAQQPVVPSALSAPPAIRPGLPLFETPQHRIFSTLTPYRVPSMHVPSTNTQTQIAAQYQTRLQPSFLPQPQLLMQAISNVPSHSYYPASLQPPSVPLESATTTRTIQNYYPNNVASRSCASSSAPLYNLQAVVDPAHIPGPQHIQSPAILSPLLQSPQLYSDPSSSHFMNTSNGFQLQNYSEYLDPYNAEGALFRHLHVLNPLLNAARASQGCPIDTVDTEDVRNLLLSQNTEQVMDRLLDNNLVEEDPFQASMGLVWMQKVGLFQ